MAKFRCRECNTKTDEDTCPDCGAPLGGPLVPSLESAELSDPDASLDQLVEAASVPNLAALFRKGKETGLFKPAFEYTNAG